VATATGRSGRPIPLPPGTEPDAPDYLAVAPDGGTIYVGLAEQSDAEVTGIDLATGATLPWTYHPDGWAACYWHPMDGRST
jgi:DNA-binding beta-propeller fold protein YncE